MNDFIILVGACVIGTYLDLVKVQPLKVSKESQSFFKERIGNENAESLHHNPDKLGIPGSNL